MCARFCCTALAYGIFYQYVHIIHNQYQYAEKRDERSEYDVKNV